MGESSNIVDGALYLRDFPISKIKKEAMGLGETTPFHATIKSIRFQPIPQIVKVIFNEPATIVFWNDGTKTVVKARNEEFDVEKGLAMAIAKKAMGNRGNYFNEIKKWTERNKTGEKNAKEKSPKLFEVTYHGNSIYVDYGEDH